jgi:tetratricopeptide (TPR) repeat protein
MSRLLGSSAATLLALVSVLLGGAALAQGAAPVTRLVVLPFDASRSVESLGLASAGAVQRALNQVDGVYVPPVGDPLLVLQRASQANLDPIAQVQRVFDPQAVILARIVGQHELEVELVVVVGDDDRSIQLTGSVDDLSGLWHRIAERVLAEVGVAVGPADQVELRQALADAPSLPVLGPLGIATARLPGARLDDLEMALSLESDHPWLLAETARVAVLQGQLERGLELAERAAAIAGGQAEVRAVEGVVRSAAGDAAGAETAFRAALAANPVHAVALAGLADVAAITETEGPAERVALLERAVTGSPRLVDAHLSLAALHTDPTRRLQTLRRAAERLPDSVVVQRALMADVLAAGDARGALTLLQQAARDPIGASATHYALAAELPTSVATEALAFVREGRERFPASTTLALAEADLLVATGDLSAAEGALRRVLTEVPDNRVAAEALATVLARSGRIDEARAVLLELDDPEGELELRLIELQLAAGRARAALAELEPRVTAGDRDPMVRTLYGIALGRVGRIDEAMTTLRAVIDEDPGAEVAVRALTVLEEQRRVAGDDALRLEGEAAVAFEQGLYALETGDFASAAASFAQARSLQEAGLLAFYEGFARQRQGDSRGAIAAYTAALEELGDNDVLLNNLGFAQLQVGRLDLALETLRASVTANPDNALAQLNLGLTYYGLGNFAAALERFEAAVDLAPELEETAAPFIDESRRRSAP